MTVTRRANHDDIAALLALGIHARLRLDARRAQAALTQVLRLDVDVIFLTETPDGELLGWVHVCRPRSILDPRRAVIEDVVVARRAAKEELGPALVEAAEAWAVSQDYTGIRVATMVFEERPRGFFRGLGYRALKDGMVLEKRFPAADSAAEHGSPGGA